MHLLQERSESAATNTVLTYNCHNTFNLVYQDLQRTFEVILFLVIPMIVFIFTYGSVVRTLLKSIKSSAAMRHGSNRG